MPLTMPFPFALPKPPAALPGAELLRHLADAVQPPPWVIDEVHNRLVLLLNHIIQQEPAAQQRLRQQRGRSVRLEAGRLHMGVRITPAGLLNAVPVGQAEPTAAARPGGAYDLVVRLAEDGVLPVVRALSRGEKPRVSIEGDVQLAAELAWLTDNLRWDVEEDLSRFVGDAWAHHLVASARMLAAGLRAVVSRPAADEGSRGL